MTFEITGGTLSSPNGWYAIAIAVGVLAWNVYNGIADRRRKVLVRQVGTSITDRVESRCSEGTIFQFDVSITNDSPRRPVVIAGYRLVAPWKDEYITLVPDPAESVPHGTEYKIRSWAIGRPRDSVLNHRVNDKGKLAAGDNLTGTLIFRGVQPIPENLGREVEVEVHVILADGKVFPAKCELRTDREARPPEPLGQELLNR